MRLKRTSFAMICFSMLLLLTTALIGCEVTAEVAVQLVKLSDNTPYPVSQMKVFLEDENGKVASALTDANGKAVFPVTAKGKYKVTRVEGLDVTGGAEGAAGREFVKASPISTSAPQIVHVYTVCPAVTVVGKKDQVEIKSPIPTVRKTTILKSESVDTPDETSYYYSASGAMTGRLIIRNRNCDVNGGLYVRFTGGSISMIFALDRPTNTGYMVLYSGGVEVITMSNIGKVSDTLTLEIPGNGDWAFTSKDAVFTRADDGLNSPLDSLVSFGRDVDYQVFDTYNFGSGSNVPPNDRYRFDFEFQKFEEI